MYQNVEQKLELDNEPESPYSHTYKQYRSQSKSSNILQNLPIISKIKEQDKLFYLILIVAVFVIFMFSFVLLNNSKEIKNLKLDNLTLNMKLNDTIKILEDEKKINQETLNSIQILKQTIKSLEDNMYKNTKQIVQIEQKFQLSILEKISKKSFISNQNENKNQQSSVQVQTPISNPPIISEPAVQKIIPDAISQQFEQSDQNDQNEQQIKDSLFFSLTSAPIKFSQTQFYVSNEYTFEIPNIVWIYQSKSPNYLNQLYIENIRYMSSKSSFVIRVINEQSIQAYIPQNEAKRLKQQIDELKTTLNGQSLDYIIEKLVLLNILNQNGGIMISGSIALAQDLNWIKSIVKNEFVNKGNRGIKPQMIGFYSPEDKDLKKKFNIKPFKNIEQPDKYVLEIPAISDFFFASIKRPNFLAAFLSKLSELFVAGPEKIKSQKQKYKLKNPQVQTKFNEIFTLCSQIVLNEKQKKLDEQKQNEYKHFAFDYYGLYLINSYYGPYKLLPTYPEIDHWVTKDPSAIHRFYYFYTHYSYEELTEYVGPIRYLFKFNCQNKMNQFLEKTKNNVDVKIFKGSLVQKLFYPQPQQYNFIEDNPEKPLINLNNQLWNSLPKIIWVFWSEGIKNAPLFEQICFQNLKKMAKLSGFQVRQLNNTNKRFYIENSVMDRIQKTLKQVKMNFTVQTVSDLYRTYLIYKYGGIYLDITTFPLQKFDWILNIGQLSSEYILNRFGDTPTVLLMRHPFDSQPEQWDYYQMEDGSNTKINWNQGFQSSFIAGQKDNQLVKQWFDLMLEYAVQPYENFKNLMIQTRVYNNRWTQQYEHYLFVMDAIKCVMGRRQLMLEKENSQNWVNAADYYKVWTINSYLAQTKLRSNLNFQVPSSLSTLIGLNQYLFRYPQEHVDKLVGKTKFLVKFFGYQSKQINQFVKHTFTGDYTNEIHSRSIFSLYFWSPRYKIESKNNILTFNPGQ